MKQDKCRHDSLRASAPCGLCPAFMVTDTFRVPHGLMTTGTNLQRPSAIPHHDFHLVPRNFPETFLKPPLKTHHSRTGAPFLKMGLMPVDKIVSQTTKCERDARFPLGFQYACKTGQQRIFWGQQVGRNIQEAQLSILMRSCSNFFWTKSRNNSGKHIAKQRTRRKTTQTPPISKKALDRLH